MIKKLIENFKNNKLDYLALALIVLLALHLRMINIEKPEGLWFDEIYCWYIATAKTPAEFFLKIFNEDFHAPLYFILLNIWMKLFSNADLHLRMFSVTSCILSIPIVYLIGREFDRITPDGSFKIISKTGLVSALFVAINSLLIYYSQEVRFYTFIFLISALITLFFIKFYKKPNIANSTGIVLSLLTMLYTLTISPFYLVFVIFGYALFLFIKKKESLKQFVISMCIVGILYLPYLPIILHHSKLLSSYFISLSEMFKFDINNVIMMVYFTFSPFVAPIKNGVPVSAVLIKNYFLMPKFWLIVFLPVLIGLFGLIKSIRQKNILNLFIGMSFAYFIFVIIIATKGTLGFMPKFLLIALPQIIVGAALGLCSLKNIKLSKILITGFVLINILYIIFMFDSAPRLVRDDTYGIPHSIMKKVEVTSKDIVFSPFAPAMLKKYANYNIEPLNLSDVFIRNKDNSLEMMIDKSIIEQLNKDNAKKLLKPYIFSQAPPKDYEDYFVENIYKKLNKTDKFVIAVTQGYVYSPQSMQAVSTNDGFYKIALMHSLLYTKLTNDTLTLAKKYLKLQSISKERFWIVYIFEKQWSSTSAVE